ncbi:MAG: WG repeat-containing protein, partial [Myxococcales bacterium]|nr:WG repeat-containing protein [Myxococcales bacterium]
MLRALILLALLPTGMAFAEAGDTAELGLYPVHVDGRAGFMDRTGKVVIPAVYDEVSAFSEGLARVKVGMTKTSSGALTGGTYGYIDRTGKVVIPPRFEYARDFNDGRAAAREGRDRVYIDPTGAVAIRGPTGRTEDFSEGLAAVEVRTDRWAFLKPDGSVAFALPPDADMSDPARFHEGHAAVDFRRSKTDRGTRYYNRAGEVVLEIPHRI